jgi:hypothetical protein
MWIYKINIDDYEYIGSTYNKKGPEERRRQHVRGLIKGTHVNKKMQNVFNKHQTFRYTVLCSCLKLEHLIHIEEEFILQSMNVLKDKCLNLTLSYSGGSGWMKFKSSEEIQKIHSKRRLSPSRQQIRNLAHKQTLQAKSEEEKEKIYKKQSDGRKKNLVNRKNYTPINLEITIPGGRPSVDIYHTEQDFFKKTRFETSTLCTLKQHGIHVVKRILPNTKHNYPKGTIVKFIKVQK